MKMTMRASMEKPEPISYDGLSDRSWAESAVEVIARIYPAMEHVARYKAAWETVLKLMAPSGIKAICGDMFTHCRYCGQKMVVGEGCPACGAPGKE